MEHNELEQFPAATSSIFRFQPTVLDLPESWVAYFLKEFSENATDVKE